jgi:putative CocE/NonD family hydrolase
MRKTVECWIGPWSHDPTLAFPTRSFGPQAALPLRSIEADWLDRWLKESVAPAQEKVAPSQLLHIFVMGPNVWREEHEWPLARTQYRLLYLNSGGDANSDSGNGALTWKPVRRAAPDTFSYDPKRPVPTTGGSICCDPKVLPPGPLDQTQVERRADVLVYTSPVLQDDVEVTGPIRAAIFMATSANDTDITAKLVDVLPSGKPLLVTDGLQRLRYRLSLARPVFVRRNTPYEVIVNAGVTSYTFQPGHRIRLEISSSNFPRFDRNLNTTEVDFRGVQLVKAQQTIYHEKKFPSALILPVIPKVNQRRH